MHSRQPGVGFYGGLPLSFEENRGQAPDGAFLARGPGYDLSLRSDRAALALRGTGARRSLTIEFVGADHSARPEGLDPLPGVSHYYVGEPAAWLEHIPNYSRVRFEEVYPGIDIVYYGTSAGQLEYDLVVYPGADPARIRMRLPEAESVTLQPDGDIDIELGDRILKLQKPVTYQKTDGGRTAVESAYLLNDHSVSFWLGEYAAELPLVIDPVLTYSTLWGTVSFVSDIAVDVHGQAYLVGLSGDPPNA